MLANCVQKMEEDTQSPQESLRLMSAMECTGCQSVAEATLGLLPVLYYVVLNSAIVIIFTFPEYRHPDNKEVGSSPYDNAQRSHYKPSMWFPALPKFGQSSET